MTRYIISLKTENTRDIHIFLLKFAICNLQNEQFRFSDFFLIDRFYLHSKEVGHFILKIFLWYRETKIGKHFYSFVTNTGAIAEFIVVGAKAYQVLK